MTAGADAIARTFTDNVSKDIEAIQTFRRVRRSKGDMPREAQLPRQDTRAIAPSGYKRRVGIVLLSSAGAAGLKRPFKARNQLLFAHRLQQQGQCAAPQCGCMHMPIGVSGDDDRGNAMACA